MALPSLAGALAVFGAGLLFGVAAVAAVAVTIGRAARRPPDRPPGRVRRRQPTRPGRAGVGADPALARPRQSRPGRPDPISLPDGGDLLLDLERLGVTVARGPAALVDLALTTAATNLAAQLTTRSFDLILAGFQPGAPAGATSCADLTAALDLVTANAVAVRRRVVDAGEGHGDAPSPMVRIGPAAEPGVSDPALTVLVSRVSPTPAELRLLVDLVAEPGGAAALLPARAPHSPPGAHVLELTYEPAGPAAYAARLRTTPRPRASAPPEPAEPT